MQKVFLTSIKEMGNSEIVRVDIEGLGPIAVYQVDGEYLATSDTCTHMEASLSEEGELEDYVVECTVHNCRFDIRTGIPISLPCKKPLETYTVSQEGEDLYIQR